MKKTESVVEFLARGGQIKRVPYNPPQTKESLVPSPTSGHSSIMSYDFADLYYGETRTKKSKKSKKSDVDFSALPPELKKLIVEQYAEQEENS